MLPLLYEVQQFEPVCRGSFSSWPIGASRHRRYGGAYAAHWALKISDAATVAPLQYTLLLWAVVFEWMFFGDVPRLTMLIGAALIVASGLFIFLREQILKKTETVRPAVPE
ncbi:EamA-like transporter family protein [compost metagenome]